MIDRNEFEAKLSSPGEDYRLTPGRLVAIIEQEKVRVMHGLGAPSHIDALGVLLEEVIASENPGVDLHRGPVTRH